MVSKFGEEKVKPLSVPASYGYRSREMLSFHWSPSHRLKLSTPTNQSGLGTMRMMKDSCGNQSAGRLACVCTDHEEPRPAHRATPGPGYGYTLPAAPLM